MLRALKETLRALRAQYRPPDAIGLEELQSEAQAAVEAFDGSQSDLGDELGIDRSVISRAARKTGLKHAAVQARVVSHVRSVPVERRSTYRGESVEHRWIIGPPEAPRVGS
jgi:hypothetical protein